MHQQILQNALSKLLGSAQVKIVMIISCSRRTDIPAFYSDWLINRIREGNVQVRNPMNARQVRRVSLAPADVDIIVFWTKDPSPMLDKLRMLNDYLFYFQFTLTPYDKEIEPHLPPKAQITDTFLRLSDRIGAQRVVWRYDPILFTDHITVDYHIDHYGEMARRLAGHTEKCVISFIDMYRHIQKRMAGQSVRQPGEPETRALAQGISRIAGSVGIIMETCAEKIDLSDAGIGHGKCVDDRLISELTGTEVPTVKDRYQRELCGCAASVDIGEYNTCGHLCNYCYANVSRRKIDKNRLLHNDQSPLLIGEIDER